MGKPPNQLPIVTAKEALERVYGKPSVEQKNIQKQKNKGLGVKKRFLLGSVNQKNYNS